MELFCELRDLLSNLGLNRIEIEESFYSDQSNCTDSHYQVATTFLNDSILDIRAFQTLVQKSRKTLACDCVLEEVLTTFFDLLDDCNSLLVNAEYCSNANKLVGQFENDLDTIPNCLKATDILQSPQMQLPSPPTWNASRTPTLADVGLSEDTLNRFTSKQEVDNGFDCMASAAKEVCDRICFDDLPEKQAYDANAVNNVVLNTAMNVLNQELVRSASDFSDCADRRDASVGLSSLIPDSTVPLAPILSHISNMILQSGGV